MRRILSLTCGAVALSSTLNVQAQMPTTDFATLAELITANQERAMMHYATQAWEKAKLQFQGESSAAEIDAMNTGFAGMTFRTTQTMTELFNLDRLREALPAISACGSATINVLGKDSMCSEEQARELASKEFSAKHATFGMSQPDQRTVINHHHREHFDACLEHSGGNMALNKCADSSIKYNGDTLSPEDIEIARRNIDLITGVAPDMRSTPRDVNNMTPEEISNYNSEMKRLSYRAEANLAMHYAVDQRESPDPGNMVPSPLHRLKAESNSRWGNEEWLTKITNTPLKTNPEDKNLVMETQLLREMALMDAFSIHVDVIKYEQSLRDYNLQAAILALLTERL